MQISIDLEQAVLRNLRQLSPEKQQHVLDFTEFLKKQQAPNQSNPSLKGIWSNLVIDITEEDMAEARREMWGNFPRSG
ncbi:MAG: DUF2281 domain-containing protein [Prochlorotrichaceae cyanobacterium]|jgi:mRNA-degrading endonuclease RelE of RelBE toxin-antitoxin system